MKIRRTAIYGGIFLLLLSVILFNYYSRVQIELPKKINQLHLIEEIRDDKAKDIVNNLHQKEVAPKKNALGKYQSVDGNAILYISAYTSKEDAIEQFRNMAENINSDKGVFTHIKEIKVDGHEVIMCLELNQAHYYFVVDKNLYWFTVDVPIAQSSVKELVKLIKQK